MATLGYTMNTEQNTNGEAVRIELEDWAAVKAYVAAGWWVNSSWRDRHCLKWPWNHAPVYPECAGLAERPKPLPETGPDPDYIYETVYSLDSAKAFMAAGWHMVSKCEVSPDMSYRMVWPWGLGIMSPKYPDRDGTVRFGGPAEWKTELAALETAER